MEQVIERSAAAALADYRFSGTEWNQRAFSLALGSARWRFLRSLLREVKERAARVLPRQHMAFIRPVIQHWRAVSPRRLWVSEIRGMQKVVEAGGEEWGCLGLVFPDLATISSHSYVSHLTQAVPLILHRKASRRCRLYACKHGKRADSRLVCEDSVSWFHTLEAAVVCFLCTTWQTQLCFYPGAIFYWAALPLKTANTHRKAAFHQTNLLKGVKRIVVSISAIALVFWGIVNGNHAPWHKSISSPEIILYLILGTPGGPSEEFISSCIACFRGNQLLLKVWVIRRCLNCCFLTAVWNQKQTGNVKPVQGWWVCSPCKRLHLL